MLLNTITDHLTAQMEEEKDKLTTHMGVSKRRVPHFRYERIGSSNSLKSLD
jgi:hypothetical protein